MFNDAKRELKDDRAVIVLIDQREFSDTIVVRRKWENIPLEKSQEYVEYLDSLDRSFVNPAGCPPGTYKILRNTYINEDGEREIHQFLAKDLRTDAPITEALSLWRLANGNVWHSGSSQVILELRDVDPLNARDIAEALPITPDKFTNAIYTVTDGLLDGTWYNRQATYSFEETGVAVVRWFLSRHNNEDFWTTHYADEETATMEFYKLFATDTSKEDFLDNYYFDPDLNWYYTEDGGTNYTKLNGVDTAATPMPPTADNLRTPVEGRSALVQADYSDQRDDWFLTSIIRFGLGDETFLYDGVDNRLTYSQSKTTSISKEWGFGVGDAVITAVKAKYAAPPANGVVHRVEISKVEGSLYNFTGITITKSGTSSTLSFGNKTIHLGRQEQNEPTAAGLGIAATSNVNAEVSYNVEDDTWSWTITERKTQDLDGEGPAGEAMVTYGEPLEVIREWHYTGKDTLPNNGNPDIGSYALDGKSMTRTRYAVNLNSEDATYSWRKTEVTTFVPTGTFNSGNVAFYEKDHRLMRNWSMDGLGDAWKTSAVHLQDYSNMLNLYFAQISRVRTVEVSMSKQFFVQQPTDAMLPFSSPLASERLVKVQNSVAQAGRYMFVATTTTTTLGEWELDTPGFESELINYYDVFMTKTIWDRDTGNPEYNRSAFPIRGEQILAQDPS
jgi:hypothetical protein